MSDDHILYHVDEGVAIITLNRPEQMNAVTDDMLADFQNRVNETIVDDSVRAVVVTGNGRAFCAGTDVSAGVARNHAEAARERAKRIKQVDLPESSLPALWQLTRIPKPTIAAVNGAAVGMGVEWTAQCDFRIASEGARFGWVFPMRGITPDTGAGPYLLPHIVGLPKALELMYSGEIIDAAEAERIGLVSRVVAKNELLASAISMAKRLTAGAPLSIKAIKELTYGALEWPYDNFSDIKTRALEETSLSEDAAEGVASFLEKRPPVWTGR
jgi:enoyl-CoA hydratase/carnithine racemase